MGMPMVHPTSTSYPKDAAPVSHIQSPFMQSEQTSPKLLAYRNIYRQHHKLIRCILSLLRHTVYSTVYPQKGLHVIRRVDVATNVCTDVCFTCTLQVQSDVPPPDQSLESWAKSGQNS